MRYAIALALALLSCAAIAAEPVAIPLKDVWAYEMPGTQGVRTLEKDAYDESVPVEEQTKRLRESHIEQIVSTLHSIKGKAKEAFVVEGIGKDALSGAYNVLVKNEQRQEKFPKDTKLSLVFFSSQFGYYVRLTDVVVDQNAISVHYNCIAHDTKELTVHFALIPLGAMTPGNFEVKIVQDPIEGLNPVPTERIEKVVCKSFLFRIE